jgi:hypothetical protein
VLWHPLESSIASHIVRCQAHEESIWQGKLG